MKVSLINPKWMVTGITGITGIATPSVIAGQKSAEVSAMAVQADEMKIELEEIKVSDAQATDKIKELKEENRKLIEAFQSQLKYLKESSSKKDRENRLMVHMLEKEKSMLWQTLKDTIQLPKDEIDKKDMEEWFKYLRERCKAGYCDNTINFGYEASQE